MISEENVDYVVNFLQENYHTGDVLERAQVQLGEMETGIGILFFCHFSLKVENIIESVFNDFVRDTSFDFYVLIILWHTRYLAKLKF